jgi:hypothetical protein
MSAPSPLRNPRTTLINVGIIREGFLAGKTKAVREAAKEQPLALFFEQQFSRAVRRFHDRLNERNA